MIKKTLTERTQERLIRFKKSQEERKQKNKDKLTTLLSNRSDPEKLSKNKNISPLLKQAIAKKLIKPLWQKYIKLEDAKNKKTRNKKQNKLYSLKSLPETIKTKEPLSLIEKTEYNDKVIITLLKYSKKATIGDVIEIIKIIEPLPPEHKEKVLEYIKKTKQDVTILKEKIKLYVNHILIRNELYKQRDLQNKTKPNS